MKNILLNFFSIQKLKYSSMKKFLLFTFTILLSRYTSAQYQELHFNNYQPMWMHYSIDEEKLKAGELGWDKFFFAPSPAIVKNDKIFILDILSYAYDHGGYLQALDINTGKQIWYNAWDLRNSTKFEDPSFFYFDQVDKIRVLSYRDAGINDSLTFRFDAHISTRTFDPNNGALINHYYNDEIDSIKNPVVKNFLNFARLYPYQDNQIQYVKETVEQYEVNASKLDFESYITGSNGEFIADHSNEHRYKYFYIFCRTAPILVNNEYYVDMIGNSDQRDINLTSNKEFHINFYDRTFKLFNSIEISKHIPDAETIILSQVKNGKILIVATEKVTPGWAASSSYYLIFDFNGNLLEKIEYRTEGTVTIGGFMIENEPGIFIEHVMQNRNNNKISNQYLKSDGKGNLEKLKLLTYDGENYLSYGSAYIHQLENGDLILQGAVYKGSGAFSSNSKLTMRLNGKDFNLNPKTVGTKEHFYNELNIFPNPSGGSLAFELPQDIDPTELILRSIDGKIVKHVQVKSGFNLFHFHDLSSGIYLTQFISSSKVCAAKKWIKQ